jgi:cytochrome P450
VRVERAVELAVQRQYKRIISPRSRQGAKRCLGASFSMRELITMMHVLLREGEFSAVDDQPEKIVRRSIMVAPQHRTRVRFRRVKTPTP